MGDASKLILLRTRSQMKRRAAALAQPQYAPLPPRLIPEKLIWAYRASSHSAGVW